MEKFSSEASGGDWDIFCLEHSIQPDGKIYSAMCDISPTSGTFKKKTSFGFPELYMDPRVFLNIMATGSLTSVTNIMNIIKKILKILTLSLST